MGKPGELASVRDMGWGLKRCPDQAVGATPSGLQGRASHPVVDGLVVHGLALRKCPVHPATGRWRKPASLTPRGSVQIIDLGIRGEGIVFKGRDNRAGGGEGQDDQRGQQAAAMDVTRCEVSRSLHHNSMPWCCGGRMTVSTALAFDGPAGGYRFAQCTEYPGQGLAQLAGQGEGRIDDMHAAGSHASMVSALCHAGSRAFFR